MSEKQKINVNDLRNQGSSNSSRKKTKGNNSELADKTVTFVDGKGRMWTAEMNLPLNTSMEVMRSIAQSNIGMMGNKPKAKTELVVLIEPHHLDDVTLDDVERVVIFERSKLDKLMGG